MKTALISFLAFTLISPVFAQELSPSPTVESRPTVSVVVTRTEQRDEMRKKIEDAKDEVKKRIEEKKAELEKARQEGKDEIEKKKEELKKTLQEKRDQKKAERITNIQEKLTQVNTKRTAEMLETVNRLNTRALELKKKIDELEKSGVSVINIKQALSIAEGKIATAKKAVEDQQKKQYVISIDDPANDRLNVGKVVSKLQDDLQTVRKLVIDARLSLVDAAKLYAQAKGDTDKTGKVEPTKTPEKENSEVSNP